MGTPPPDTAFMHMEADVKQNIQDTPDTEMTSPLTSPEQNHLVDSSIEMSDPFRSARDRAARMTSGQGQANPGGNAGGSTGAYIAPIWRRNAGASRGTFGTQAQMAQGVHGYAGAQSANGVQSYDRTTPTRVGTSTPTNALAAFSNTQGLPPNPRLINYHPETGGPIHNGIPYNETYPGPLYPTAAQRQFSFAYCYDRGNGNFTQLVPADELPGSAGYRPYQGAEGMMVLPVPQAQHPSSYAGQNVEVPLVPRDVAAAFPLYDPSGPKTSESSVQATIDTIVGSNVITGRVEGPPPRREKIYCDKWVHEGTCAFTQVGCKYKHEMPHDRATQKTLGLNGYPTWYKRALEVNLKTTDHEQAGYGIDGANRTKKLEAPGRTGGVSGRENWRSRGPTRDVAPPALPAAPASPATSSNGGGETVIFGGRHRNSGYGPIAPPSSVRPSGNKNSYQVLEGKEDVENGEDEL